MAGQIDEEVLDSFRAGADDFRDLDSIIRRHCQTVRYYVYRGSTLGGYDTDDVEVLLKDRNGSEAKIESVILRAAGLDGLQFNVHFHNAVAIDGECEDRASLVLLATETRGLIRDRMKGGTLQRRNMLYVIAAIFFVLGYFVFQQYQSSAINKYDTAQGALAAQTSGQYQRELETSTQELLSQATASFSKHNLVAEVGFLVQQQIGQLRQQLSAQDSKSSAASEPPPWATSYWLLLGVAIATAAVMVGYAYLALPANNSVFLIGDEKQRQDRADKRRTQIRWGIGVPLVLGIFSSVIATAIFR